MFKGGYRIDDAIVDSARAAYVATLLETGHTEIERYSDDPLSVSDLSIPQTLPDRLKRLRRNSPEAFYYWANTGELL